jgi:hypothetical protein
MPVDVPFGPGLATSASSRPKRWWTNDSRPHIQQNDFQLELAARTDDLIVSLNQGWQASECGSEDRQYQPPRSRKRCEED